MTNKLFDLEELTHVNTTADRSEVLRDNFLAHHDVMVQSLKDLLTRLPQPGEFFALWTMKSFNAFTFIPLLIRHFGQVDQVLITTYSINQRIIDSLVKKMDDGRILDVTLFLSDSLKYRMPRAVDHLSSMMNARESSLRAFYAWNHSKITLARCQDQYFVIEGSGNWSENAQFEQYLFFNDHRLYEFRKKCITHDLHTRADTGH